MMGKYVALDGAKSIFYKYITPSGLKVLNLMHMGNRGNPENVANFII